MSSAFMWFEKGVPQQTTLKFFQGLFTKAAIKLGYPFSKIKLPTLYYLFRNVNDEDGAGLTPIQWKEYSVNNGKKLIDKFATDPATQHLLNSICLKVEGLTRPVERGLTDLNKYRSSSNLSPQFQEELTKLKKSLLQSSGKVGSALMDLCFQLPSIFEKDTFRVVDLLHQIIYNKFLQHKEVFMKQIRSGMPFKGVKEFNISYHEEENVLVKLVQSELTTFADPKDIEHILKQEMKALYSTMSEENELKSLEQDLNFKEGKEKRKELEERSKKTLRLVKAIYSLESWWFLSRDEVDVTEKMCKQVDGRTSCEVSVEMYKDWKPGFWQNPKWAILPKFLVIDFLRGSDLHTKHFQHGQKIMLP